MAAVSGIVQALELGQHLRHGLDPRHPSIEFDNVAELASKRAAARKLHAEIGVLAALQQIEARDRSPGNVGGEFLGLEHALPDARLPGPDECPDDALGFSKHLKVRGFIGFRRRGRVRPADRHGLAPLMREFDDPERIGLLRQHPAGHDEIGPIQIGPQQLLRIPIDEAALP